VTPHVLSRAVHQLHWIDGQNLVTILQLYICDMYTSYVSYCKIECIFIIWIMFLFDCIDATVEIYFEFGGKTLSRVLPRTHLITVH